MAFSRAATRNPCSASSLHSRWHLGGGWVLTEFVEFVEWIQFRGRSGKGGRLQVPHSFLPLCNLLNQAANTHIGHTVSLRSPRPPSHPPEHLALNL